ncbi:hypothetical protein CcaverHIS002_0604700 [Cutaneotrichosporon cavernicola]|uniref:Uncharacterized protein n=1 Tax=Cutaneotrichosporon cavernicola TaxID=279322 RepID=A0AA48L8N2_9TREE|nr:uncharacterized protein CcaverHIS019_0604140 [Cutaneotrichosporon cavernicola]BEI86183.1 hypothetical protein CcaverHIS002_0604700 [Cutaneotrichosporon cavernicola]BEI93955.1 hypothetical protein CcaverHIS019_0604140 [Cutaneotrichosporon cavernicola]BEJ01736.1 hypothetical protein CcaverHIS631_0604180 [Cutaneotrichosporon cavernicola]BEJ09503.1 hypothetical protein CcaverHIS641_0604180 [Cutaneotrichosporon cavernicola]
MDFLKQAQGFMGQQGQQQQQAPMQQGGVPLQGGVAQPGMAGQPGQATGQQDALDKGVDMLLGKLGHKQSVAVTEKISDGVRSAYKSATGKDIPIKDQQ